MNRILKFLTVFVAAATIWTAQDNVSNNAMAALLAPSLAPLGSLNGETFGPDAPVIRISSNQLTAKIVRRLNSGESECSRLQSEYRPDCLSKVFQRASREATAPDYRSANAQLNNGSRRLSALVSQNVDKAKPTIRGSHGTYRAVKKAALKAVNRAAQKIVAETATKLIRSAGSSKLIRSHYQKIAQAVESTKRIFRS